MSPKTQTQSRRSTKKTPEQKRPNRVRLAKPDMVIEYFDRALLPGARYTLKDFARRINVGEQAIRTFRRKGLKIIVMGRNSFVRADDWFEFQDQQDGQDNSRRTMDVGNDPTG